MNFPKAISASLFALVFAAVNAHENCSGNHRHKSGGHEHGHKHEHRHHDEVHEHKTKHEHRHEDAHALGHAHGKTCSGGHNHDSGSNTAGSVEVGEPALKSMNLSIVHPEKRRLRSTVSLLGRMELSSEARKDAPSPIPGVLSVKVRELDMVAEGDVLFTVNSPSIKSLSQEIAVLESRLLVYRKLKITNAEIESALKVKTSEKAALIDGAEESNGVVTVRAPASGMIEKINSTGGSWVETGATVISLVNPQALRFRALAASSEAAKLNNGMKAFVDGVEAEIRLGVGDETGMTPVYAVFCGRTAPGRSGMRAKAECVLNENETPVTAVPDDCIMKIGAEPVVFIRDHHKPNRFTAVKIGTGMSNGGWTEVHGLPEDGHIEIVNAGAYGLKLALAAKSAESKPVGHYHADGVFHEGEH
jgi:acetyl/propionyl-CoA carboxylase alpha subunit